MSQIFLKILNMSLSASWLVLAVLLLRLVFKRAPKWVSVLLWGIVAIRLICPVSVESVLSLIPSAEVVSPTIMMDPTPEIHTGIESFNSVINPVVTQAFAPQGLTSMNPLQLWIPLAALTWLLGLAGMLIYTAVSYMLLRRKVSTAVLLRENIFQSEQVASPFVLGLVKPRIYLPFRLEGEALGYVIAHEQAHISRKDHLWKPLGFLLLAIHWFNPLMWVGYILLCRDIELACDEKVIREMDSETKADYTQALVTCSVSRRSIAACPLAFGEVGVKQRVKSVLHYKKPAFWVIVVAVILCIVVAVCFLTNPVDSASLPQLRNDEVNMPVTLGNVTEMTLTFNGATIRCSQEDIEKIMAHLDTVQVGLRPISLNRAEDRPKDFTIQVGGRTELHFNAAFTEFWEDNHVKPSLSHRITNPAKARELISVVRSLTNKRPLTLEDVTELSKKGYDLTWSDFAQFEYLDTGSGLYIWVYEINEVFSVWIGGTDINEAPWYIYLRVSDDLEQKIDIRDGGVEEFVAEKMRQLQLEKDTETLQAAISQAILDKNAGDRFPDVPTGAIHTHSYRILALESASGTPMLHQDNHMTEHTVYIHYLYIRYYFSGGYLETLGETCTPAAITFAIDEDGNYTLQEFWEPNPGETSDQEIRAKFPEEAAKFYLEREKSGALTYNIMQAECYAQATDYLIQIGAKEEVYRPYIDRIDYDIDGDGRKETVTLTFGPTSGWFSVALYAETTKNSLKYVDTYVLGNYYDFAFAVEDGMLRLKGSYDQATPSSVSIDVGFKDGHITLWCEDEKLIWGSWDT